MIIFIFGKDGYDLESIKTDVVNLKARNLLKDLIDLNRIETKGDKIKSEFQEVLDKLGIGNKKTL